MNCFKFLKKSLEERREFVKTNKLCENCLSKGHLLESCISKFNCRKDGCSQKHHTLLHKDQTVENVVSNKIQISHNETISPNTYLQIIPVIVSNRSKSIRTNALLDTGSDSTFVTSDISQKLNLQGKTQQISLCNVLSNKDTFNSKLVDFEISSMTSPTSVHVKNAWIVDSMKLPSQRINTDKLKNYYEHLAGIQFTPFDKSSEISVLIGADNPMLHMYTDVRIGKKPEPVALKTKLGWVIFGGNKYNKKLSLNAFSTECTLDDMVSKFWEIESYGGSEEHSSSILPEIEQ